MTQTIENIVWDNAAQTSVSAVIGGKPWVGITPGHDFWKLVTAAIEAGAEAASWVPPPEPTPAEKRRQAYVREADGYRDSALSYMLEAKAAEADGDGAEAEAALERMGAMLFSYIAKKREIRARYPDDGTTTQVAEEENEEVYVMHSPKTDKYHSLYCRHGRNGVRVTLAEAQSQLGSAPAGCCLGKE